MTTTDTYLLAEGVLLCLDDSVIVVKGLLQLRHGDTDRLCKLLAVFETLHETTADVVLAVPLDLLRGLIIQNKANGELEDMKRKGIQQILVATKLTLPFSHILPVT